MTPAVLGALWLLALVTPLVMAGALVAVRAYAPAWTDRVLLAAPAALAPALALTLAPSLTAAPASVEVPALLLGSTLHLDPVGRSLTLVAVLLYGAAVNSLRHRTVRRPGDLAAFLLLSFVGNVVVYVAGDVATFYLGYGLMSFASFALVLHERTGEARRANRVYVPLTILSEFSVLAALMLIADAGGFLVADAPQAVAASPHAGVIVALLILGFGVKAGLVPLHVWLPLAHPAAPPAASAVLSGAMVKAGLVGWLRFLPLGETAMPQLGLIMAVLALVGAFAVIPVGVIQRDPKVVLAYSTVSQMGYLAAVVATALAVPQLVPAAISAATVYAVHHGLAKGALFMAVPVWKHHASGRRRWLTLAGFTLAGAVVAGAPFSSGSVGKYATKYAVEGVSLVGVDVNALLPFVATGSTLLVLRAGLLLWRSPQEPEPDASAPEYVAWWVLVATSVVVPFLVTNSWLPVADTPDLDPVTLWDATWPVLLGLALGAVAWLWRARTGLRFWRRAGGAPVVPAGDIAGLYEAGAGALVDGGRRVYAAVGRVRDAAVDAGRGVGAKVLVAGGRAEEAEGTLEDWRGSGVAVLLTLVVLALLGVVL